MASKHFQNTARRAWWSVHIEAWQRSGLSRAKYCVQHGLDPRTFGRWIGAIGDTKSLHYKAHPKRRSGASRLCTSKRSPAVQAFWAMHVEALNWSGLAAAHYAAAHRIPGQQSAPLARSAGDQRGGDRLARAASSERPPETKH